MFKYKEELSNKLFNEYLDKDLSIFLAGSIEMSFTIHKAKFLINDYRIIITDSKKEEIIIKVDEIIGIKLENCIVIDLGNQQIIIDY